MATFGNRLRTLLLGHANEMLQKVEDADSIPVLKQNIRDLESGINTAKHEAAVAAAQVTTLTRQKTNLEASINTDKDRAKAYLAKGDDKSARTVATRIHDNQVALQSLEQQIADATAQANELDGIVEKLNTKHNETLSRVRSLEMKNNSAKALEQSTSSLKSANALLNTSVDSSVDNLAGRVEARNDLAKEEFKRTVSEMESPEDPLKSAAVDDILASLK